MTALVSTSRSAAPPGIRAVGALALLDESERHWSSSLSEEVRKPTGSRRRALVVEALLAYERLRASRAPDSGPLTVYRRWPACTLVSLVELAHGLTAPEELHNRLDALGVEPAGWLAGWAEAWSAAVESLRDVAESPELALAVLASGAAGPVDAPPPRLRLDVERGALTVVFPGESPRGERVVIAGGDCPRDGGTWLVPTPARIAACHDLLGQVHPVRIVDVRDPLLVFDTDGEVIPAGEPLPGDDVWVLHLGEPAEGAVDGRWRVLEKASPPVGWTRWWLALVSLADATALRSAKDFGAGPQYGPWRPVAGATEADLAYGAPLATLRDAEGDVVYEDAPVLSLPGGPGQTWNVEVQRTGGSTANRWTAHGGTRVRLADRLPEPRIGRFRVRASTPGFRTVRGEFTLAQGVSTRPDVQLRLLRPHGGLLPARVRLTTPPGVRAEPAVVHLGKDQTETTVELHAAGLVRPSRFRVSVPYCAHRIWSSDEAGPWSTTPHRLTTEQVAAGTCLDLRLPDQLRAAVTGLPELVAGAPDDQNAQRVRGRRVGSGEIVRYRLASLLDALQEGNDLPLQLALPGQSALVAIVHGVAPARDVAVAGPRLRLLGRLPGAELEIVVRAPSAPWVPPHRAGLGATEAEILLGPPFHNGTVLDVAVHAPGLGRFRAFRVGDPATAPACPTDAEQRMSRYLAGVGPLPEDAAALPLTWWGAAYGGLVRDAGLRRLVAQECAEHLAARPAAAMHAALGTGLPADLLIEPLVRSGLAAFRFRHLTEVPEIAQAWSATPLLALLMSSPVMPYLSGSPVWDPAEMEPDEAELLHTAQRVLSVEALDVLAGRRRLDDPLPSHALLGGSHWPATRTQEGGPELETFRTFARSSPFAELLAIALHAAHPLSLGTALVARLAAQGDHASAEFERDARPTWVEIVTLDPGAAAGDLVLAELLVSSWHGHRA